MINNPIYQEMTNLNLISPHNIEKLSEKTRDKEIQVYLDTQTKIIFIGECQTTEDYYESFKTEDRESNKTITKLFDGTEIRTAILEDDNRRFNQFKNEISGKIICDFGCGYGGFLRLADEVTERACGVELRNHCYNYMKKVVPSILYKKQIEDFDLTFDVITIFHVLEHIPCQVQTLQRIHRKLNSKGKIVVEVPHAEDFLIQSIDLPEFRNFTFWSEHLVLHTKDSLWRVLKEAGFKNIDIIYFQRYGFTNHLNWFLNRKPGGHETLKHLENVELEAAYKRAREVSGTSDTLIAVAQN